MIWDTYYAIFWGLPYAVLTNPLRPRIIGAVGQHIQAIDHCRNAARIEIYRRAMIHPAYRILSPEDIALGSRVLITTNPRKMKVSRKAMIFLAYVLFSTCSLLVIGTELTISWNYILNVNSLRTVGQLIPAAMGIGGLIQVIWSALFEKAEDEYCLNRCKLNERKALWKEAGDAYDSAIKALERSRDLRGKKVDTEDA
jgi:hypothetical protein